MCLTRAELCDFIVSVYNGLIIVKAKLDERWFKYKGKQIICSTTF